MGKQAFDKKMEAVAALRDPPEIRKALKDRNNFLVSKAAKIAGELGLQQLIPDLSSAFDRFMTDPVKSDPKCWAKNAIAKSLKDLGHDDVSLFVRGLKHIQMEPSFGPPVDSALTLRGTCAMALVACPLPRMEILKYLVDALGADPAKPVRMDATRAIAQIPGPDSILLLRLKARVGDRDAEVTGQCFVSLLEIDAREQLPFVEDFLRGPDPDARLEALAALGECHDPEATAAIIRYDQTNPSPEMKRAILLTLGVSRHTIAADFLLKAAGNERPEQAILAIQSLARSRFHEEYQERLRAVVAAREDAKLTAALEKEFSK